MIFILILYKVYTVSSLKLDIIDCGIDNDPKVSEGDVKITQYPWLGVLYYKYWGENGETRAVATVALIHKEFVVGSAADIGPMPKTNFRRNSRVLLGEGWNRPGRRVRNYVLHPEYGETYNTICLVQLKDIVRTLNIRPLCPPPKILKNPEFYVVKLKEDLQALNKEVVKVMHIPGKICKDFYVAANLYSKMMRPPHVACAVMTRTNDVCVWDAGAALVARDTWGRWQLLGVGVRGPGCGAPSRFFDMMSYYPWIESSLEKFQQITISKLTNQKYVIRSGDATGFAEHMPGILSFQRFGACDPEEKTNLLYRELVSLRTESIQYQFMSYNLTILQQAEFSCLTLQLINASAQSEMRIKHRCDRLNRGPACYKYVGSRFDISVYLLFSDTCLFEIEAYGFEKNMTIIDIHQWKWNEGAYYEDFTMQRVEYRGPTYMTDYGFEPLDLTQWIPEYDIWTSTEPAPPTVSRPPLVLPHELRKRTTQARTSRRTRRSKKKPRFKTTPTTTTTTQETTTVETTTEEVITTTDEVITTTDQELKKVN